MSDTQTISNVIPQELRDRRQWVVWQRNKSGTKFPMQTTGTPAKVDDPSTWTSFDEVVTVSSGFAGIGFVITGNDPYCGIDLDNCIDEDGNLRDWSKPIVEVLVDKGYGEVSPSGRGIKFLTIAEKPKGARCQKKFGGDKQQLEMYDGRGKGGKPGHRWWAMTGDVYHDCDQIGDGGGAVTLICNEHLMPATTSHQASPNARSERSATSSSSPTAEAEKRIQVAIAAMRKVPVRSDETDGSRRLMQYARQAKRWCLSEADALKAVRAMLQEIPMPVDYTDNDIERRIVDAVPSFGEAELDQSPMDRMVNRIVHDADDAAAPSGGEWVGCTLKQNHNELAIRFVDQYGADLRFVRKWQCWCVWEGSRWRKDESGRDSLCLAREFARGLWGCIGEYVKTVPTRDEIAKCVTFIKSTNQLTHMESFLKVSSADRKVLMDHDDLNPDPMLLNVANGTIDLRTGEIRKHRQRDLITLITTVTFDPSATCPKWIAFLDLVFDGDAELIRYVRQLLGYSVIGSNDAHVLPIAWGGGCNGKSTLSSVMIQILGEYATTAMESLALGTKNEHSCEVADLYGRRFVAINEPESGERLRESRVKMLTGDSQIAARGMRENPWTFDRTFLLWMSTNHKPRITGTDEAIWRRIKVIPFTVDIRTRTTPIPDLDRVLVETEGAGILNWLIAGCLDYQRNGFAEPECVKLAVDEYRHEEDQLGAFIDECCLTGQDGYHETADKLFDAYCEWAGKEAVTKTLFGREMARRFRKEKPTSGQFRRKVVYYGVTLTGDDQGDQDDRF